jgi:large subunit ribosomal protein L17
MRHGDAFGKLGRDPARRMRLLKTLCTHLFEHERIQTTLARAKELVRYADKVITLGKRADSEASRLKVFEHVCKPQVGSKVLVCLAERFNSRSGGYTRIWRAGLRQGDKAPIAIVELVDNPHDLKAFFSASKSPE